MISKVKQNLTGAGTFLYTIAGFTAGLIWISSHNTALNLMGVLVLGHALICSSILVHESIHGSLFTKPAANTLAGRLLCFLNGSIYVPFRHLKRQHLAHHLNRVGVDGFSIHLFVQSQSRPLKKTILLLEYFYIPVMTIVSKARSVFIPLLHKRYRHLRVRAFSFLVVRAAFFAWLFVAHPRALLYYGLALWTVITVFRVYDCFQHSIEIVPLGQRVSRRDQNYELENTYSTSFSRRYPAFDLLFLNFGYHTAHHFRPDAPWSSLSRLHRTLPNDYHIGMGEVLKRYHSGRVTRLLEPHGRPSIESGRLSMHGFNGVIMNVSFIDYDFNEIQYAGQTAGPADFQYFFSKKSKIVESKPS